MVERESVERALRAVVDPCSAMSGVEVDIVDMGLVRTIEVKGDGVKVELQLTDGTCYFSFHLVQRAQEALDSVAGIGEVEVELVAKELWSPERMAPEARRRLAAARAQRRELLQIEPWARRSRAACGAEVEHGARL